MYNIPPFALYSTSRGIAVVSIGQIDRGRVEITYLLRCSSGQVSPGGGYRTIRPFVSQAASRLTTLPRSVMESLEDGFAAIIPDAWLQDPTKAIDPETEEETTA